MTDIILDPTEAYTGTGVTRQPFNLNGSTGVLRVAAEGIDWGDAAIDAIMNDGRIGSLATDYRIPNRQVSIPLVNGANNHTSDYLPTKRALQTKVARIQAEGGILKRGTGLYADIVHATLKYPDGTGPWLGVQADIVLTLECLPDFYSREETLGTYPSTGGPSIITLDGVKGDYPARCTVEYADTSGNAQAGLIGAFRSRHRGNPGNTNKLTYPGNELNPVGAGRRTADAIEGSVGSRWTPLASTTTGNGRATHKGTYRVFVRSQSAVPVQLRFRWDSGQSGGVTINPPIATPGQTGAHVVDLGQVTLTTVRASNWVGNVEARNVAGDPATLTSVTLTELVLLPLDEAAWILRAHAAPEATATGVAWDEFDSGGAAYGRLADRTAPQGGKWADTGTGPEFVLRGVQQFRYDDLRRGAGDGLRFGILGPELRASQARVKIQADRGKPSGVTSGVVLRYKDAANWVRAVVHTQAGWARSPNNNPGQPWILQIQMCVNSTTSSLGWFEVPSEPSNYNAAYGQIWFQVQATGDWSATYSPMSFDNTVDWSKNQTVWGKTAELGTGAALASGRGGVIDGGGDAPRYWDWFTLWELPETSEFDVKPTVCHPNRRQRSGTTGHHRESPIHDNIWGNVPDITGDLPRLPVSGQEGRPADLLVRPSRGNYAGQPDSNRDDAYSVTVRYYPCWLFPIES